MPPAPADLSDPDAPPASGVAATLSRAIAANTRIASAAAGAIAPNDRLCAYLGGRAVQPGRVAALGEDPTMGFCQQLTAIDLPGSRPREQGFATAAVDVSVAAAAARAMTQGTAQRPLPRPAVPNAIVAGDTGRVAGANPAASRRGSTGAATAAGTGKAARKVGTPAARKSTARQARPMAKDGGTRGRYIQLGAFAVGTNANAAIRKLNNMGLPAAQTRAEIGGKPVQIILSGPFAGRTELQVALGRLRAVGFTDAYAR
ncbi:SPOR domain-containing protein [Paracoccus pacificus]|uniref:SPOR domain-containing protein n=1 Tax=Paracoccus pacificus TaxID=1463598 RepID=A0ABW4RA22_9RHOB